jgi:hypothetical protein
MGLPSGFGSNAIVSDAKMVGERQALPSRAVGRSRSGNEETLIEGSKSGT